MGRRSRQRIATPTTGSRAKAAAEPSVHASGRARETPSPKPAGSAEARGRREGAPTAPWGAFPLIELCALSAIVLGVWGILRGGHGGGVLLIAAAMLGSVAGLEVAIREHVGGYRSHTLVLAGTLAVATIALLVLVHAERTTLLVVSGAVLVVAFAGLREVFKRRSGGFGFRVR